MVTPPERKRVDRRAHARLDVTSTNDVHPDTGRHLKMMTAITELKNVGGTLLTDAVGPRVIFEITKEIKHEIQWGACDDFGLTVEREF